MRTSLPTLLFLGILGTATTEPIDIIPVPDPSVPAIEILPPGPIPTFVALPDMLEMEPDVSTTMEIETLSKMTESEKTTSAGMDDSLSTMEAGGVEDMTTSTTMIPGVTDTTSMPMSTSTYTKTKTVSPSTKIPTPSPTVGKNVTMGPVETNGAGAGVGIAGLCLVKMMGVVLLGVLGVFVVA